MMEIIDVGGWKQLFLDEALASRLDGVRLRMNPAMSTGDVLVRRAEPCEQFMEDTSIGLYCTVLREKGKIRLWWFHRAGLPEQMEKRRVCYAESEDGIHFSKPHLGLKEMGGSKANSAVIDDPVQGSCVWIDPHASPERRYRSQAKWGPFSGTDVTLVFYASPDGIHWETTHKIRIGACDTQTIVFWDERYGRYVMYTRYWERFEDTNLNHRKVRRLESDDLVHWENETIVWEADCQDLALRTTTTGMPPVDYYGACVYKYPEAGEFYVFLAQPFWHWQDRPEDEKWGHSPDPLNLDKRIIRLSPSTIDVRLGYSRDGIHFHRAKDRGAFLGLGPHGRFDSRMVWALPNPIQMGDEIWIYYVGLNRDHDKFTDPAASGPLSGIGRATLRLDGFVSAEAAYQGGILETPLIRFEGRRLSLNLDAGGGGSVKVELLDKHGNPVPGRSRNEAVPVWGNSVRRQVRWSDGDNVGAQSGQPVRLRFHMRDARLYAFQFGKGDA